MAGCWARPSGVGWLSGLLVSVTMVAAVSGLIGLLEPQVPVLSLLVLYLLAVLPVAIVWGTGLAVVTSILGTAVFAYLFLPPVHSVRVPDSRELAAMGVFLVTAVVVGELAARSRRVALEGARLSQEQSALRRVATLVARGMPSAEMVQVDVDVDDGPVRLAIRDDGVGGADPSRGSGLVGLKDRVEATGGILRVESRPGQGTYVLVELPIHAGQPQDPS
jgi:K+-sensing histidine kinase KdpD